MVFKGTHRNDIEIAERSGKMIVRNGKGDVARVVPLSGEVRQPPARQLVQEGSESRCQPVPLSVRHTFPLIFPEVPNDPLTTARAL